MTASARGLRALPYVIVGAAAAGLYHVATTFEYQARPGTLGPDFWPKLVLAAIGLLCAYELVSILLGRRTRRAEGALGRIVEKAGLEPSAPADAPPSPRPGLLAAGVALTIAYVALLPSLGFFTGTLLYTAAFIALGGYRRPVVIATVSVIGTLFTLFFFMRVVYISLPLGTGPFKQLTLWLMTLLGIR